ncbi:MAG: hypothetical protein JWN03_1071 [Nocardia sp.]|uniref:WXG100-like domain-containing protein n=1 Tax=Nocardia sp. TaxID=1821 RepID=UPI002631DB0F|nr:hypothetical protein [Nocardia sp.]MCU1640796.1 hypothetical protein [Nocardia sp.]
MTVSLADVPKWVVDLVAGPWPEGDESAMRRLAALWNELGDAITNASHLAGDARNKALSTIQGETGKALAAHGINLDSDLASAAQACHSLADQLVRDALSTELTKYIIKGSILVLAAQLGVDLFMPGPGEVEGAAATAATRLTVRAALRSLIENVGTDAARAAAGRLVKAILFKGVTIGALQGGGVPLVAETVQMMHGNRKWGNYDSQVEAGLLAGAAGGLAGEFVGGKVMGRLEKTLTKDGAKTVGLLGRSTVRILGGAAGGGAGAVAGEIAQVPVTGHLNLRWDTLIPGLVGGAIGTLPHALRGPASNEVLSVPTKTGGTTDESPKAGTGDSTSGASNSGSRTSSGGQPGEADQSGGTQTGGQQATPTGPPAISAPPLNPREVPRPDGAQGQHAPQRGADLPQRAGDLPQRTGDLPQRTADLPQRTAADLPQRTADLPQRTAADLPQRTADLPQRTGDQVTSGVLGVGDRPAEPPSQEVTPADSAGESVSAVAGEKPPVVGVTGDTPPPDQSVAGRAGGDADKVSAQSNGRAGTDLEASTKPDPEAKAKAGAADKAATEKAAEKAAAEKTAADSGAVDAARRAEVPSWIRARLGDEQGAVRVEGDWTKREFLPPLNGRDRMTLTGEEFMERWEQKTGRKRIRYEESTLEWGCVGVTSLFSGIKGDHPQYNLVVSDPETYPRQFEAEQKLAPLEQANSNLNETKKALRNAEKQLEEAKSAAGPVGRFRKSTAVAMAQSLVNYRKSEVEAYEAAGEAAAAKFDLSTGERRLLRHERDDAQAEHSERSLALAREYKTSIEDIITRRPATRADFVRMANEDPKLSRLRGLEDALPPGPPANWDVVIWVRDFYSGQDVARDSLGHVLYDEYGREIHVATEPNAAAFAPDPVTGQVDMSQDRARAKALGMGNFDFHTEVAPGVWAGANHREYPIGDPRRTGSGRFEGPMEVSLKPESKLHNYGGAFEGSFYDSRVYGLSIRSLV